MNHLYAISKNELRAELMRRGLSLSSFARKHGFPQVSVHVAFRRHCGNDSNPYGKLTKAIVRKLYEEIQTPIESHLAAEQDKAANA